MNSYRVLRTFESDSERDIQTLDYSQRVHNWIILLYLVCKSRTRKNAGHNRTLSYFLHFIYCQDANYYDNEKFELSSLFDT